MAVFGLPQLQELQLEGAGAQPYGGVAGRLPGYREFQEGAARRQLELGQLGLQRQMQEAEMEDMTARRGLASRGFDLANRSTRWDYKFKNKMLEHDREGMNLQTLFGVGMAGLSAYEGRRRARDERAYRDNLSALIKKVESGLTRPTPSKTKTASSPFPAWYGYGQTNDGGNKPWLR
jgi:hypothetical protein